MRPHMQEPNTRLWGASFVATSAATAELPSITNASSQVPTLGPTGPESSPTFPFCLPWLSPWIRWAYGKVHILKWNNIYFKPMLHWTGVWGGSMYVLLPRGLSLTRGKILRGKCRARESWPPIRCAGWKTWHTEIRSRKAAGDQALGAPCSISHQLNDRDRRPKEADLSYWCLRGGINPETGGCAAQEHRSPEGQWTQESWFCTQ